MRLLLVKHAPPKHDFEVPASEWELSAEGGKRATALAKRLASLPIDALWTSPEPKAAQTAAAIADACDVEAREHAGLIEHRREAGQLEPWEFRATVRAMFRRPAEMFFGIESASDARGRFARAVEEITADDGELVVVVAHGTVISLYAEAIGAVDDGAALWDRLTLPAIVTLDDGVLHTIERFPSFDFMREDGPAKDEEVERLRNAGNLGRLGDVLRSRHDPAAVGVLEEAVANATKADQRAFNQLRLAIALQYEHRLIEALDMFDIAADAIAAHAPEHLHYLFQHRGKCLIEAGRLGAGVESLNRADSLRRSPELAGQLGSTRRALSAATMRVRQYDWHRRWDHYRGLADYFSRYFTEHGPEEAQMLAQALGAILPGKLTEDTKKQVASLRNGGTGCMRLIESLEEWWEMVPEILARQHLAEELEEHRGSGEAFRTHVYWWSALGPVADTLGIQPHGAILRAGEAALIESFPDGRIFRVTVDAWFVDADDALERIALREVEDRARRAVLDLLGIDDAVERLWRNEGPRFNGHPLEIDGSGDGDILAAMSRFIG